MPQVYRLLGQPQEPNCCCPRDPAISPLHGALHGLPPTQIHVGDSEVMLSDSVDFGQKARAAGSPVSVVVWPRMWHTFTQYSEGCGGDNAQPLQEALDALQQQGNFLCGLATGQTVLLPTVRGAGSMGGRGGVDGARDVDTFLQQSCHRRCACDVCYGRFFRWWRTCLA